jgi:hypothetical protein
MKKVFAISILVTLLASCNTTKITNNWVAQHCNESHVFSPESGKYQVKVQCDSLYHNEKMKSKVKVAVVCLDVRNAFLSAEIESADSALTVSDLIKLIQFKK